MDIQEILEKTGGCGRYQIILTFILHSMKCIVCFSMVAMVFGAVEPDWWCMEGIDGQNQSQVVFNTSSLEFRNCYVGTGSERRECTVFKYDGDMRTVVTEWDLICGNEWKPSTITSLQMAGVFAGNLICGQVADLIGRKTPLFLSLLSLVILNIISIFSTSWMMFAVLRLLIGLSMGIELTVQYNILAEFTLARWRAWAVAMPSWATELALYALTAWLLQDWKLICVVTAATGVPVLLTYWFVPESFRWYVAHDRTKDAARVVKKLARINGRQFYDASKLEFKNKEEKSDRKYSFIDLVKSPSLRRITLLLIISWMTLGLGGYGIQFGVPALSGDLFLNIFLIAILGSPLQFVDIYLANRFGRKKTSYLFLVIFAITAFIVGLAQRFKESELRDRISSFTAILSLTAINAAWSPIQTLTIELYPTVVRNMGYGLQNTMARVGAIIGPQLVFLDKKVAGMMYLVCGVVAVLSIVTMLPLEETRWRDLRDKLSEDRQGAGLTELEEISSEAEKDDDVVL